jgi:ubiquinone/menaquinone biosynthesis C-methylase UbiE
MMREAQLSDTLREWHASAKYWERHARTIQKMFAPLTSALIEEAGIGEGDRVLDVAGGPGEPSLTIAEKVGPTGFVMCTDAVGEMVAAAKSEATRRGLNNIRFQQCLADSLPFENNTFDVAVSRLGVMFFPDTVMALREILRVVKPEGALSFVVWHESSVNPFVHIVTGVVSRHITAQPTDPDAPGAFRFAEPGKLVRVLTEAGAIDVRERLLKFQIEAPISRDEFWEMRSATSGTLREKLDSVSTDLRVRIANEVKEAVAEFFPNERMSFQAQMLVVTGNKRH